MVSNATVAAVFTDVANAIRARDGTTATIQPINYADRIAALPSGVGAYSLDIRWPNLGYCCQLINTNDGVSSYTGRIYSTDVWLGAGKSSNYYTADAYKISGNGSAIEELSGYAVADGNRYLLSNVSVLTVWNSSTNYDCMYYLNDVYYEISKSSSSVGSNAVHAQWLNRKRSFLLTQNSQLVCDGYVRSCLCAGTKIRLSDGSIKKVEDISYDDELLTWDMDEGKQSARKPILISDKGVSYPEYNLLTLEDGTTLETIFNHSWFNVTKGRFTRCVEGTDVGDLILTLDGPKKLVSKEVIDEQKDYYTIITEHDINCYANGILTGNAFCNLYPIKDMKYAKTEREKNDFAPYEPYIDERIWKAYRADEAPFDKDYMLRYLTKEAAHFNLSKYDFRS